jgi:hypothetical protein
MAMNMTAIFRRWRAAFVTFSMTALLLAAATLPPTPASAADFKAGYMAYQRGDFAGAAKEWLALAKAGHTKAQYNIGILYDQGKGVVLDRAEAVRWWRKSAESGFRMAQHNLANSYISGDGVGQVMTMLWSGWNGRRRLA